MVTMTKTSVTKLITTTTLTEADEDVANNDKYSNNVESSDSNNEGVHNTDNNNGKDHINGNNEKTHGLPRHSQGRCGQTDKWEGH